MLRELLLRHASDRDLVVEHDGSGRGRALVDGEDEAGHDDERSLDCLTSTAVARRDVRAAAWRPRILAHGDIDAQERDPILIERSPPTRRSAMGKRKRGSARSSTARVMRGRISSRRCSPGCAATSWRGGHGEGEPRDPTGARADARHRGVDRQALIAAAEGARASGDARTAVAEFRRALGLDPPRRRCGSPRSRSADVRRPCRGGGGFSGRALDPARRREGDGQSRDQPSASGRPRERVDLLPIRLSNRSVNIRRHLAGSPGRDRLTRPRSSGPPRPPRRLDVWGRGSFAVVAGLRLIAAPTEA